MKYIYTKYLIFLLLLFIFSCTSTQSSYYKPSDDGPGWKVKVIKKASITDEFICSINDSVVIKDSFPLIGDNFEKAGTYRGKKVVMNGYKSTSTTTDSQGKVQSTDKYQIRVFINDVEVDKFDF